MKAVRIDPQSLSSLSEGNHSSNNVDPNSSQGKTERINQLDTLRFLCFLAVFLEHCNHPITIDIGNKFIIHAGTGVQIFFVISGFLITRLLLKRESQNKLKDIGSFYARRAFRILPLYYFYLTILIVQNQLEYPLWHLTGLYNYKVFIMEHFTDAASHLWTLCLEMQFYLLFPWILLGSNPKFRFRILGGALVSSVLFSLVFSTFHQGNYNWLLLPFSAQYFLVGALFAFCDLRYEKTRFDSYFAIAGLVLTFAWLGLIESNHCVTEGSLMEVPSSMLGIIWFALPQISLISMKLLGLGLLVYGIWRLSNPIALKVLKNPITSYLGLISYGLYVYHLFFVYNFRPQTLADITLTLAATIFVSAVSWRYLESPLNRLRLSMSTDNKSTSSINLGNEITSENKALPDKLVAPPKETVGLPENRINSSKWTLAKQSYISALAVSSIFILSLVYWYSIDKTIQVYDSAAHLILSYNCLEILQNTASISNKAFSVLTLSCFYPPLTFLIGGLCKSIFGLGFWVDRVPMLFFYTLMCICQYKLADSLLKCKATATLSVAILCLLPSTFGVSHAFGLIDLPLLSTTLLALWAISAWYQGPSWKKAMIVACCAAVAMLTKQTGAVFVLAPIGVVAVLSLIRRDFKLFIQAISAAAIPSAIFGSWLYLNFESMKNFIGSWQATIPESSVFQRFFGNLGEYIVLTGERLSRLWCIAFILSFWNKQVVKQLWIPLVSALSGLIFLSAFNWTPQARYLLPALIFVSLLIASAAMRLWNSKDVVLRSLVIGFLALGSLQYIFVNLTPYPIPFKANLTLLTGPLIDGRSEPHSPEWRDHGLNWVLKKIEKKQEENNIESTASICVIPDSQYVSSSNLSYLAKTKEMNLNAVTCKVPVLNGYKFVYDENMAKSTNWYLFLDPEDVEANSFLFDEDANRFKTLCKSVRESSQYTMVASRDLETGKTISLYLRSARLAKPLLQHSANFGETLLLQNVRKASKNDSINLVLNWRNLSDEPVVKNIAVHLLDSNGKMVAQHDYVQDLRLESKSVDSQWYDTVTVPKEELSGVAKIGIAVYDPTGKYPPLTIDFGDRDWDGRRLLIPIADSAL